MSTVIARSLPPSIPHQGVPLAAHGSLALPRASDQQPLRAVVRIKNQDPVASGSRASLKSQHALSHVAASPALVRVARGSNALAQREDIRSRIQDLADLKKQIADIEETADRRKRWRTQTYYMKIGQAYLTVSETRRLLQERFPSTVEIDKNLNAIRTILQSVTKNLASKQARADFFKS